jgi:uncharacterized protein (TIGR00290 family)
MLDLAVFNWSGGKDSTLALHFILIENKFKIHCLFTTVNEYYNRVSMHGVRVSLLEQQAESLQLPLHQLRLPEMPDMQTYENAMTVDFLQLKSQNVHYAIYGDIFLEDLRLYREAQMAKLGMKAIFPLWGHSSKAIVEEFIALGYKTIVVCAKDGLQDFCGRVIDQSFLNDLPATVDPCGENGEFHTFVYDGPIFKKRIEFKVGELVLRDGYWYIDLVPLFSI